MTPDQEKIKLLLETTARLSEQVDLWDIEGDYRSFLQHGLKELRAGLWDLLTGSSDQQQQ